MMRLTTAALLALALAGTACSEKPQTAGARKTDAEPWTGTRTAYTAPGWKPGDEASWDSQIRARAESQNEYARAPNARP